MPLRDGNPTRHELRVAEMCAADPEFAEAYFRYMAEFDADAELRTLDLTVDDTAAC